MPNVLPIAVAQQVCPMVTGIVPHVGGPIEGPGAETVLTDEGPVATVTSLCVCVGPPSTIVTGAENVLAEDMPMAVMGMSMTDHAGDCIGPPVINVMAE